MNFLCPRCLHVVLPDGAGSAFPAMHKKKAGTSMVFHEQANGEKVNCACKDGDILSIHLSEEQEDVDEHWAKESKA